MVFFFSSSFLPLSNRLTKALPFRRVFSSLCCSLTLFPYKHTHSFPFQQSFSLTLPRAVLSPPPLPRSWFASPPPPRSASLLRQCESAGAVRLLLPQRAGLKRSAWELSLSLSLALSPSFVSSQGDEGAALWAVEEVRGSPGSSHSAAACCFAVVRLHPSLPHSFTVRVCQSCLPLPPLSSPLIDSSFRLPSECALSASLSRFLLFLALSALPFPFLRLSSSSSPARLR